MASPAWKVAEDIAEGYISLNPVFLKRYAAGEMSSLQQELDKASRDLRATVIPQDDADASQKKNRKLLRLSQANIVLQAYRSKMGR
jgi:hypothetical protein